MADIEPPSFSLGLEADLDSGVGPEDIDKLEELDPRTCVIVDSEDEEVEKKESINFSSDPCLNSAGKKLKRLRRGSGRIEEPIVRKNGEIESRSDDIRDRWGLGKDEDIEEFSSQEDPVTGIRSSTQYVSVCSTSKMPLRPSGLHTHHSWSRTQTKSKEQNKDTPLSSALELGHNGVMLPRLTVSPLRRFQLIDSDSEREEPSKAKSANKTNDQTEGRKPEEMQSVDLWRDFEPLQRTRVETPVFDEVCSEYFQTRQQKGKNRSSPVHRFPSHTYVFSDDPRIRKLVSTRLPHFSPLEIGEHQQAEGAAIDYIGQFSESSSKEKSKKKAQVSSSSGSSVKPKNVGKRRVHANSVQASGYWYTSSEGRKVYVSQSGQELSGGGAYRCYKKETGGFKKVRRKSSKKRSSVKSNTSK